MTISKAAADILARRILEIQSLMTATIQHRADLLAKRPDLEAQAEENLLSPGGNGDALAAWMQRSSKTKKGFRLSSKPFPGTDTAPNLKSWP